MSFQIQCLVMNDSTQPTGFDTVNVGAGEMESPPLPSINKRLAHLRPSRELLEFYRRKIAEFDTERDEMMAKLEQYKSTYEQQHKIQWEMRQREDEIAELQKALSDIQVYLFQEREHVLRLYAENDRLKIRELEDRKKIHTLLMLSGLTEREVSYFLKEPPAKAIVEQKLPPKLREQLERNELNNKTTKVLNNTKNRVHTTKEGKGVMTDEEAKYYKDNQTLALQVEALQAQLAEQTKLAKEQIDAMLEDRRVKMEESDTCRERDLDKIKTLTEKLHKTQDLLYDSTRDFLELRYEGRANERKWMGEKDKMLRDLDTCKQQLNVSKDDVLDVSEAKIDNAARREEEIQALQYQVEQGQKLADMYREQVIQLEDELAKIREEGQIGKDLFKERSEKVAKRLELMNQRYQDLEKRRNLEVEGFKTDIRNLRGCMKDLEKQLYKVTIGLSDEVDMKRPDDIDMRILRNVRRTAGRSKHLVDELKTLKSKVYGLENDLKHL